MLYLASRRRPLRGKYSGEVFCHCSADASEANSTGRISGNSDVICKDTPKHMTVKVRLKSEFIHFASHLQRDELLTPRNAHPLACLGCAASGFRQHAR